MKVKNKGKYAAVICGALAVTAGVLLFTFLRGGNGKKEEIPEQRSESTSGEALREEKEETSEVTGEKRETPSEEAPEETASSETAAPETEKATETATAATTAEPPATTPAPTTPDNGIIGQNPAAPTGSVRNMITLGLSYVSKAYGYSLNDREGKNGHFDCSGLVAVLLRDGLGEGSVGRFSDGAWDTAYWRYFATLYPVGSVIKLGAVNYRVTMRDSYDFENAWAVPGSIVIQYPPENDPSVKMGHASVALGKIPYGTTADVIEYLKETYGVDLSGIGANGIPKVYDQYGAGKGHISWKINANGVAGATCVDNNYASRPEWIEKISVVLVPEE